MREGRAHWAFVHAAYVIVVAFCVWGRRGGAPPLFLAVALPAVLALSHLRREPLFPQWIATVVPVVLGFWLIERDEKYPYFFLGLGFAGLTNFPERGKGSKATAPLAALAIAVFLAAYFSGGQGGSGRMVHWLLAHGLSGEQAHSVTLAFRKTVHYTFYGVIGWTALRAARASGSGRNEAVRTALLAAFAVAGFDELRQSAYANRTGSAWDVLLDLAGASTFVGLSVLRESRKR